MKQPNLSAKIGVKSCGRWWRHLEATRPVSQDRGKVVVGSCGSHLKQPNLSATIGFRPSVFHGDRQTTSISQHPFYIHFRTRNVYKMDVGWRSENGCSFPVPLGNGCKMDVGFKPPRKMDVKRLLGFTPPRRIPSRFISNIHFYNPNIHFPNLTSAQNGPHSLRTCFDEWSGGFGFEFSVCSDRGKGSVSVTNAELRILVLLLVSSGRIVGWVAVSVTSRRPAVEHAKTLTSQAPNHTGHQPEILDHEKPQNTPIVTIPQLQNSSIVPLKSTASPEAQAQSANDRALCLEQKWI